MAADITLFTDPACPFAFSAEPNRQRLRWYYGDQLRWRLNMIVLTLEPGEDAKLAEGAPGLQRKYGMPIDPNPYERTFSSQPACRAVVAARLNAPGAEAPLLRRLRVRAMQRGLLDDPALIHGAATDVGLDPADLENWMRMPAVEDALRADIEAARSPSPAARRLDHKLGGPEHERRYTAPSYEITADGRTFSIPGYNPIEVYETALANLGLARRAKPESVEQVLAWAPEPLATVEVIAIMQADPAKTRAALARAGTPIPAGADFYWTA
ncbi:DsbA family protein [Solirubrobacter soli]|uniref:DsbA family protein n=1 Tax=Solirubrobacter soli TaxID=363832 RepID=UPI000422D7E2|nr:DsbA family protein [Solirubrobacter soli]